MKAEAKCGQCLRHLVENPLLVGACASVGIEHGKSTGQMLREYLAHFHARGHQESELHACNAPDRPLCGHHSHETHPNALDGAGKPHTDTQHPEEEPTMRDRSDDPIIDGLLSFGRDTPDGDGWGWTWEVHPHARAAIREIKRLRDELAGVAASGLVESAGE